MPATHAEAGVRNLLLAEDPKAEEAVGDDDAVFLLVDDILLEQYFHCALRIGRTAQLMLAHEVSGKNLHARTVHRDPFKQPSGIP